MSIPDAPPATLRLHIDTQALQDNWRALDRLSGSASAGAAVKAQGYGLGADIVVPALAAAGAREFFVAHWSEARDLLQHVPASQISVLHGIVTEDEARFAIESGVRPVINAPYQARLWNEAGGRQCHLMIDTGMNRLGMSAADLASEACAALDIDILMSHLASADEESPQTATQLSAFREVSASGRGRRLSLANSAGIALGSDYAFDVTRPGLALYGGIPRTELKDTIRQVVFPQAAVIQRRTIEPGDHVGYNARFTAGTSMQVATVTLGYADGFLRARGKFSALHKDGQKFPVIGRVSMDMIVIDCTHAPLREGDFLNVAMDLPKIAETSGLSQYEILTTLGNRFYRAI